LFFCNKEYGVYVLLCNKEEDVFIFFRIKEEDVCMLLVVHSLLLQSENLLTPSINKFSSLLVVKLKLLEM
jgi:hypothetical protein